MKTAMVIAKAIMESEVMLLWMALSLLPPRAPSSIASCHDVLSASRPVLVLAFRLRVADVQVVWPSASMQSPAR